jgi:hypothetical protein
LINEELNTPLRLKESTLGLNKKKLKVQVIDHLSKLKMIHEVNKELMSSPLQVKQKNNRRSKSRTMMIK